MNEKSEIDQYLEKVVFTPAVVGYALDGDKIQLGVRLKVSNDLGKNLIAGLGGKVGDSPEIENETPDEAMDREYYEETSVGEGSGVRVIEKENVGRVRFIFAHKPFDSKWNQEVTVFLIKKWRGEATETESTRPVWCKKTEIPWERMWADNHYWLPKVLAGEKVDATFLYSDDKIIKEFRFE